MSFSSDFTKKSLRFGCVKLRLESAAGAGAKTCRANPT